MSTVMLQRANLEKHFSIQVGMAICAALFPGTRCTHRSLGMRLLPAMTERFTKNRYKH